MQCNAMHCLVHMSLLRCGHDYHQMTVVRRAAQKVGCDPGQVRLRERTRREDVQHEAGLCEGKKRRHSLNRVQK